MAVNKRLLQGATAAPGGITPSEHFGVVLYEGDGSSSHSINGGKFGAAGFFEDAGVIQIPDNITNTNEHSFSVWFNVNDASGNQTLLEIDTGNRIIFRIASTDANKANFGNGGWFNHGLSFSANQWYHLAITFKSGSPAKIYVDGSLQYTSGNISKASYGSNNYLGAANSSGSGSVQGKIDQFRVFQKELSSSEVSTLYAETVDTVTSLDPLSEDTTDTLQVLGDSSCTSLYRLENNEDDESGNYDATGNDIQYTAGRYGRAVKFGSTTTSYLDMTTATTPTTSSVSFWLKTSHNDTEWRQIIDGGGSQSAGTGYAIFRSGDGGYLNVYFTDGETGYSQSILGTTNITDDVWHHVVLSMASDNTFVCYLDGASHISGTRTRWTSGDTHSVSSVRFGNIIATTANANNQFYGEIDQIRTFNKALSASEVTTLYEENSLVASYRFEGNANDDMSTYDGTASNVTYEYGLNFTPDFIWFKTRTQAYDHNLTDSTRGTGKQIRPNRDIAEVSATDLITSFDTGGFTVGSGGDANKDGDDYVAWCLKANGGTTSSNTDGNITSTVQANTDAGFAIAKVTGSGTTDTFGHGLGTTPEVIIRKNLDASDNWNVYTTVVNGSLDFLRLNTTDVAGDSSYSLPTSTVFTNPGDTNDRIYYSFVSVDGFSKFGTYRGTGSSTDTPIIDTGFEPALVITKSINGTTGNWNIYDNKRNLINPRTKYLLANSSNAENSSSADNVSFYSNGFQIGPTTDGNQNGQNNAYFYMAFAADPDTEAPSVAKSFSTVTYTGTGSSGNSITGLGFEPSLLWLKSRSGAIGDFSHTLMDTVRGASKSLSSNNSNAEVTNANGLESFDTDGFTVGSAGGGWNYSGSNYVAWAFKADDNEPTIIGGPATLVYKFEDNANDVTGDYDGTANNITYATGKFNKAAQFNGSSSYIDTNFTLPAISSYSFSFWFNTTSTVTWNDFLADNPSNGSGLGARIILAIKNGTHFHVAISNGSSFWQDNTSVSASNYVDGEWHHYAVAINGTSVKLFVDGYLLHTYTSSVSAGTGGARSITLGRLGDYNGEYFTGKLDQFRFYRGALNYDDATNLYNEKVGDNDDLDYGSPSTTIISANANAGFSIVKYTGDGAVSRTIAHGLSAAPEMVIVKNLSSADNWIVYNKYADSSPASGFLQLNQTAAFYVDSAAWGGGSGTEPSSTLITIGDGGTDAYTNKDGAEYIAYCFHSVSSYSKFGSYSGSSSAVTVTTGFKPDFVLIKNVDAVRRWPIFDSVRNDFGSYLDASDDIAEQTDSTIEISTTSTGFVLPAGANYTINSSGYDYIYWAIKIN